MTSIAVGAVAGALASTAARRLSFDASSTASNNNNKNTTSTPSKHVGILGMEVYSPSSYITQASLEEYSSVSAGRYTLGLGQEGMALCGDAEDVNSLALTVVQSLLEK